MNLQTQSLSMLWPADGKAVKVRVFLISAAMLCTVGQIGCSWPWPSLSVDNSGLGKSEIDNIVRSECCGGAEERIAKKSVDSLKKAKGSHSPRQAAESIGFTCDPPPSQTCRYTGEQKYRYHNFPKGHVLTGKVQVVTYSLVLANYDEPDTIDVQKEEKIVP
jgi:hypothetical protein